MFSRPAFARAAPFGIFIGVLVANSVFHSTWLLLARSVIVAAVLVWFWRDYTELRRPPTSPTSHWLLAVAAGFAVFLAWIWLDQDLVTFSRSPGFDPLHEDGQMNWPLALIRLLGLSLVVPVMEELFWRSFLLRWLEEHEFLRVAPRSVGVRALIITTVLFALEHNQWLAGAVAGIAYGLLYIRTGNLWVPIVAHALTNGALGVWILATENWHFW
jgi:CAAX prenyl protease-like protein